MKHLKVGEYENVKTISKVKRNRSGVYFELGEKYSFTPTNISGWKDWLKSSPLTGFSYPFKFLLQPRLRSAKYFALCGGIGDNDDSLFEIGDGLSMYPVTKEGELFLFANDFKWTYGNNKGFVEVKVERIG